MLNLHPCRDTHGDVSQVRTPLGNGLMVVQQSPVTAGVEMSNVNSEAKTATPHQVCVRIRLLVLE